jgi:hypothetical protein
VGPFPRPLTQKTIVLLALDPSHKRKTAAGANPSQRWFNSPGSLGVMSIWRRFRRDDAYMIAARWDCKCQPKVRSAASGIEREGYRTRGKRSFVTIHPVCLLCFALGRPPPSRIA